MNRRSTKMLRRVLKSQRRRHWRRCLLEPLENRRVLASYVRTGGSINDNITDNGTTDFSLQVGESVIVGDLNVHLDINHQQDADLDVYLIGPDGTRVELFTDVGGGGDNFSGTILDDEAATPITSGSAPFAGSYQPEGALSDFDGSDAKGEWTLEITDDRNRRSGSLNSWSIEITPSMPSGPPALTITDAFASGARDDRSLGSQWHGRAGRDAGDGVA